MLIKLKCSNPKCGYSYSLTPDELEENGQYYTHCLLCGCKMEVINLEEIVDSDLSWEAEKLIDKWLNILGIEGTIELIERNRNQACSRIYFDILRRRGIIK